MHKKLYIGLSCAIVVYVILIKKWSGWKIIYIGAYAGGCKWNFIEQTHWINTCNYYYFNSNNI